MAGFNTLRAVAAPFPDPNIDTDVIMPKQFLKRITRDGLAEGAFHDQRFIDGQPNPDFILNKEPWNRAEILVCGDNFGCGSSREYAVWGLMQLGIKAIIAPSFAGIFYGNCEMNGLLAITLPQADIDTLMDAVTDPKTSTLTIDLPAQTVSSASAGLFHFQIGEAHKHNLITGADHIGITLRDADGIRAFETQQKQNEDWLWVGRV